MELFPIHQQKIEELQFLEALKIRCETEATPFELIFQEEIEGYGFRLNILFDDNNYKFSL